MSTAWAVWCLIFITFLPSPALAQQEQTMTLIVQSVRDVCTNPGKSGHLWEVKALGGGNVAITLKTLASAGLKGEVEFKKGEWEGIQWVLREQQASDNADYRQCAQNLTPKFLQNFVPAPQSSTQPRLQ